MHGAWHPKKQPPIKGRTIIPYVFQLYTLNVFAANEISDNITIILSIEKFTNQWTYINGIVVTVLHMINNLWMPGIA